MLSALIIGIISTVLFLTSVLVFPTIVIGYKRIKIFPFIPLAGGIAMLIFRVIPLSSIASAFLENSSVNPIKILVLFLSMTTFSLILDKTGFFEYISGVVLKKAGKSQYKIFISLYVVVSVLTIFTSNDIIILTFTPFICYFSRSAKIDPIPYLIMEFVAANTWSLFLLIGNPTNIYIAGAFDISFFEYIKNMALPTIVGGIISLTIMILLFRKKLSATVDNYVEVPPIKDRPLMIVSLSHLIACVLCLTVSQYLGFEMWLISLAFGMSSIICSTICLWVRHKTCNSVLLAVRGIPFEIIPFIIGMFMIVLALDHVGVTNYISDHMIGGTLGYGLASLLMSNVLNNIPMSVLFSKVLNGASMAQVYATIAGSNIGAFITPIGALAGIMWLNLLKVNNVKLSCGSFVKYGMTIGLPTMLSIITVIYFIF